jgi:hypothetical protein
MPATAYPLLGSGNLTPNGAVWKLLVLHASDQEEAEEIARAQAPATYRDYIRGAPTVEAQGAGLYVVTYDYAAGTQGQPPPVQPGGQQTSPPERGGEQVGTEFSFTFGGDKQKVTVSLETKFGIGRNNARAPGFKQTVGYNPEDGSVEGTEVYARSCSFTVRKKYQLFTFGFLASLFWQVATTNKNPFQAFPKHSVLYIGADGSYSGGSKNLPWEISGKFVFSPNQVKDLKVGDVTIPNGTIEGHDYVWFASQKTTEDVGDGPYTVSRPLYGYVERMYEESDFSNLGMDS